MNKSKLNLIIWYAFVIILICHISTAANPIFLNLNNNDLFNVTQDQNFSLFLIGNDSDGNYPLNFSTDAYSRGFSVFNMTNYNATWALINFTPDNWDYGYYGFFIIVADSLNNPNVVWVYFNVSNINDPPNITSYSPTNLIPTTNENSLITLSIAASDPDVDIGLDTLSTYWFINGTRQAAKDNSLSYAYTPSYCDARTYNYSVRLFDTFNLNASMSWILTVNNVNRIPVFNRTIENITSMENINLVNNISLLDHFYDLDFLYCNGSNNNTLYFNYTSSDGNISLTIDDNSKNVSIYPQTYWAGNATIVFNVNDGYSTVVSNTVYLTINNVPDSPSLHLSNVSWVQGVPYTMQINATDPDIPYGDHLQFNFTVGDSFEFSMNDTGYISFTPITTGNHTINITVNDSFSLQDSRLLFFYVRDNHAPYIFNVSNQSGTKNSLFEINISGYDYDGDPINFSSNFSAFNYSIINSTATRFYFIPNKTYIGNHTILFSVNDSFGAVNTTVFHLEIFHANSAPVLDQLGNFTAKINRTFTAYINATDDDDNPLTFNSNASFFNFTTINTTTGLINFTYDGPPGNFSVNISVTDNQSIDFKIVNFELIYNRNPIINPIDNLNATTGLLLLINITGSDPDGDDLTFTTNFSRISILEINSTLSTIYLRPIINDTGLKNISVFVSDGDGGNATTTFLVNISFENHAPFFLGLSNISCNINLSCYFNITAYDYDGTEVNFSASPAFFNISKNNITLNSTSAELNFTPWNYSIGSYFINISINDGNLTNRTNFTIFVNRYPVINWSYPDSNTTVNTLEGVSVTFNVTASDPDAGSISYAWYLNGTKVENISYWTYNPDYSSSGDYIVTAEVSDGQLTSSLSWNLSVNNSNRPPEFGTIRHSSEADFGAGSLSQLNITEESGNMTLAKNESGLYFNYGSFVSPVISIKKEYWANVTITNISWASFTPGCTNVSIQTRSSSDLINWTDWSSFYADNNGSSIADFDKRYIQYAAVFTTCNETITPVLEDVTIQYIIPNLTWTSGSLLWLDLNDYFNDPDGQMLNYTVSPTENIDISIASDGEVTLRPNPASWYGSRAVIFNATDGENLTMSNTISITFSPPQTVAVPTPIVISGGGGGSSITTRTIVMNNTEQIYLDLLTPGPIVIGPNKTISVPITLKNRGSTILTGVTLKYEVNSSYNLSLKFKDSYFNQILPSQQIATELIINSSDIDGSYSIKITASVKNPEASDSSIIRLDVLKNVSSSVNAVRDLLVNHPECLELNEIITQAEEALKNNDYQKASLLLDSATEGCKYLISSSGKIMEVQKASKISEIDTRIVAGVIFAFVMLLLIIYYLAVTRNSQKT
jgi:hypothetical protein